MTPVVAAILAGGQSRRMGRDKANIIWQGETLLARTARIAQEAGCTVQIVGREQPEDWPLPEVSFVSDASPSQGPLGGLATALETSHEAVLLLACDLPLLRVDVLHWLMDQEQASMALPSATGIGGSRCSRYIRRTCGRWFRSV